MAEKYVMTVQDMYAGARTRVKSSVGLTDTIPVGVGLHQGSSLSPYRLQNVNGGHSGTLAFYCCPFWGACRQVTRACRQDYFLWSIFNYTEKS